MGMLRLTKANRNRDRLLIATDAICAVEECTEQKHTRVMTMDGFWYEVVDGIEKIESILSRIDTPIDVKQKVMANDAPHERSQKPSKQAFVRKRKILSPGIEKPQERASEADGGIHCGSQEG